MSRVITDETELRPGRIYKVHKLNYANSACVRLDTLKRVKFIGIRKPSYGPKYVELENASNDPIRVGDGYGGYYVYTDEAIDRDQKDRYHYAGHRTYILASAAKNVTRGNRVLFFVGRVGFSEDNTKEMFFDNSDTSVNPASTSLRRILALRRR